jgi:hypothetical protein
MKTLGDLRVLLLEGRDARGAGLNRFAKAAQ